MVINSVVNSTKVDFHMSYTDLYRKYVRILIKTSRSFNKTKGNKHCSLQGSYEKHKHHARQTAKVLKVAAGCTVHIATAEL